MPTKNLSKNFIMGGGHLFKSERILKDRHPSPGGIISLVMLQSAGYFLVFFIFPWRLICCLCVCLAFVSS